MKDPAVTKFEFERVDNTHGYWYMVLDNGVRIPLNDKAVPAETQPLMQKAETVHDTLKAVWHAGMGSSDIKDLYIKRAG